MTADLPLVSCIMPTHDRRAFAARSIGWFLRQDYPNRELVIVDDGRDGIADLAATDDRVRYIRLDRRLTLGAKRNLACEHARGQLVAHWDDDDWHAPDRLSRQVAALREAGADLCGTPRLPFYDVARHRALEYVYPSTSRRWVAGGTLLYRREWWRTHPFPGLDIGEDGAFVAAARGARIAVVPDPPFYVATIHPGNTSPKHTSGSAWRPYPEEKLRGLLGPDWAAVTSGAGSERKGPPTGVARATPRPAAPARQARPAARPVATRHVVSPKPPEDPTPRITVSIPYYRARPYIVQAVESILAQTHRNLRLVVVNDGDGEPPWDLLAHVDDPRLVRFDLASNRGRYFADAVVLDATRDPWMAIQDADDWSDPDRLAALLRAARSRRAIGAQSAGWIHRATGRDEGRRLGDNFPGRGRPLTRANEHRLNQIGLFSVAALRAIGGLYGGERVGYDTIIGNFLLMTGSIEYVDRPLYHRRIRPGSLTRSAETGFGSAARRRVWQRLPSIYRPAYEAYVAHREGRLDAAALASRLREIRDAHVTPQDREALATEAARLRLALEQQDPSLESFRLAEPPRPAADPTPMPATARDVVGDHRLTWTAWTITRALAGALADRLDQIRPKRILEIGSGNSTAVLAAWAAASGARVTTLEHDAGYRDATARLLTRLGLRDHVDLRLAPVSVLTGPDRKPAPFYRTALGGPYDFVFVDGPPQRIGRGGVLFGVAPYLAATWELWLNDGRRDHERGCVTRWRRHVPFDAALHDIDWKGVWVLRPPAAANDSLARRPVEQIPAPAPPVAAGAAVAAPGATTARAVQITPAPGASPATSATTADDTPTAPLVSAVMPTRDRRLFVSRAVDLFLRQTYPNLELIVVDDGSDPIRDALPPDPRIRYVRLATGATIGAKRNAACEAASGTIVIGWDDDDWYAPERIGRQVAPIIDGRADAVGLTQSLMLDLVPVRYWRCSSRLHGRIFEGGVVSGTLAFTRRLWSQGARFPDASLAEDAAFQRILVRSGARLLPMRGDDLFIYVRHTTNSWRFTPGAYVDRKGWHSVPTPSFLEPEDLRAFQDLRGAVLGESAPIEPVRLRTYREPVAPRRR